MKTPEEIQAKAEKLSADKGVKVHPIMFKVGEEQIVGYISEPKREAKMAAMDELMRSPTNSGKLILESCLIKEESDPRMSSYLPEDDNIVISAYMACHEHFTVYVNELKKK